MPTSLTYIVLSTRGCSPWRPAADIGTTRHESHWGLPRIFKGRRQRTGRHLKCGARPSRRAYLRPTRFQARSSSRRKDNSSRDCRRRLRVRSRCRHRPKPTPCSGSGMLTRFPVAGWRPRPPNNRPTRRRPLASGWFPRRLGSTNPCPTAVHTEPFPTSVFKVLP